MVNRHRPMRVFRGTTRRRDISTSRLQFGNSRGADWGRQPQNDMESVAGAGFFVVLLRKSGVGRNVRKSLVVWCQSPGFNRWLVCETLFPMPLPVWRRARVVRAALALEMQQKCRHPRPPD